MLLFILAVALLIRTEKIQNWLVDKATAKLSEILKTEVSINKVSASLFNRLHMEGTLVRDLKKDTLLYAGELNVRITDWFFLKNEAELQYIGLKDISVFLHRSDSIWNYQFIIDKFTSPEKKKKDTARSTIAILLQRVEIDNLRFLEKDEWYGRDMTANITHLDMDADEINLEKKKLFIHELELKAPLMSIYDYQGNRPSRPKKKRKSQKINTEGLKWNIDDWDILVHNIKISNGTFRNDVQTNRAPLPYFDGQHFEFSSINASIKDISWQKDTISGVLNFSTRERSGLDIKAVYADLKMHPEGMLFQNLAIITPHSRLGNSFAMRYYEFQKDMEDFLQSVRLEGTFNNSTLSSKDIAYFAPELKGLDRSVKLNGLVTGTITDLSAKGFTLSYGTRTKLDGDIRMQGLPDIDKTLIDFRANDFHTTYADAVSFVPALAKIEQPRLKELGYIQFKGDFNGYPDDFSIKGILGSALGALKTDLHMKLPEKTQATYDGRIATSGFDLGTLLGSAQLGKLSFNGSLRGKGFDPATASADINGDVGSFHFNGYDYRKITVRGTLNKKLFRGDVRIDDPNLDAIFSGMVKTDPVKPEYDVTADIRYAAMKELFLTKNEMNLTGLFKLDARGGSIDDIVGEATVSALSIGTKEKVFVFDNLFMSTGPDSTGKRIRISNKDIQVSLSGRFKVRDLPNTLTAYLNKYYPLYFKPPEVLPVDQDMVFSAVLKNVDQYLPLISPAIGGLDNSTLSGEINAHNRSFLLKLNIPYLRYKNTEVRDFELDGVGNMDSLLLLANTRMITINDSLEIPGSTLTIVSSKDVSEINLSTSANQTMNSAQLSLFIYNLSDGIRINFNPSSVVINDKTWRIERDGQITISRSFIDANDIRIVNGQQEIQISSLPSEIGNSNDILLTLKKVNLGDILPYVMTEPKIEGITSGDITIEDPYGRLNIYMNAQTEQTRFENDSIGIISINGNWNNRMKKATYFLNSANEGYVFDIKGHVTLADSSRKEIDTDIDIGLLKMDILKKYLGIVFTDIKGTGSGKLKVSGDIREPDITGTVTLKKAEVLVGYTQCRYALQDPVIEFKPDMIDFGTIRIKDTEGNEGNVSGQLTHRFFRKMGFNFSANAKKLQLLNTTKLDNSLFFGKAVGRVNFSFTGPDTDMRLYVEGEPVDSSSISILTSGSSKESGDVDYIVWRAYGREMNLDSISRSASNLSIDLDLTANNLLKVDVILDELSGDIISALGAGNLKITTGTNESTTLNGRYIIERGNYNFNFQDIFKKPFTLEPGSGSYISWTGDPYDAEININASYLAEKVRMSTLFNDPNSSTVSGVSSDILKEISDVNVNCLLTGTLSQPNPAFQIVLPTYSTVKNNPTVDSKLKSINRDPLEVSKQSTYLIVFKSFAPQSAIVASNLNTELFSNTISGVINSILANSVQNFFYKLFGSSVDVNFNYSRMLTDISGSGSSAESTSTNYRENVSLQFIKSLMNDKLIITFGSDFNFSTNSRMVSGSQSFLFLPDVNVEYKITPDGKFRTSFFFRSSFDALSTSGRRDRTGGNISYRTEFDRLFGKQK
jgi:hypothetical protein